MNNFSLGEMYHLYSKDVPERSSAQPLGIALGSNSVKKEIGQNFRNTAMLLWIKILMAPPLNCSLPYISWIGPITRHHMLK